MSFPALLPFVTPSPTGRKGATAQPARKSAQTDPRHRLHPKLHKPIAAAHVRTRAPSQPKKARTNSQKWHVRTRQHPASAGSRTNESPRGTHGPDGRARRNEPKARTSEPKVQSRSAPWSVQPPDAGGWGAAQFLRAGIRRRCAQTQPASRSRMAIDLPHAATLDVAADIWDCLRLLILGGLRHACPPVSPLITSPPAAYAGADVTGAEVRA